jgi:hypothetical protein
VRTGGIVGRARAVTAAATEATRAVSIARATGIVGIARAGVVQIVAKKTGAAKTAGIARIARQARVGDKG